MAVIRVPIWFDEGYVIKRRVVFGVNGVAGSLAGSSCVEKVVADGHITVGFIARRASPYGCRAVKLVPPVSLTGYRTAVAFVRSRLAKGRTVSTATGGYAFMTPMATQGLQQSRLVLISESATVKVIAPTILPALVGHVVMPVGQKRATAISGRLKVVRICV